ncbi:hypothetical protein PC9H_003370 [Pleurotus ostreatus]|uniref:DUF7721 domain-containing protein n=2 Tax=Pleurotus TaxID=5320 RepID=A0A8H7DV85_PLEOS|nr:uncharacterized protein PC9H_003370 [Pleurotus ostreatus]KAF7436537.1 hypothetical protein PC9H_003370 [Pleurotus ostreatus]KAG9222541.1 hypothetical protein CCMSSC00406_0002876 [Pleurotus cornucopiae]
MDSFINIAKQGFEAYKKSNDSNPDVSKTGGAELNSPDNRPPPGYNSGGSSGGYNNDNSSSGGYGGGYGGGYNSGNNNNNNSGGGGGYSYGGGGSNSPSFNHDEVVRNANEHGSGDSSLFSSALSFLNNNKDDQKKPVDEDDVQRAHKKVYEEGSTGGLSANLLGSAAAMQVLKNFVGGSEKAPQKESGGDSTSKLISMAMAEATKLFDKSGGTASGNKQDAVNGAAMTVMKLMVQSKFSGAGTTGGKDSGGLGQLMGLASKFIK